MRLCSPRLRFMMTLTSAMVLLAVPLVTPPAHAEQQPPVAGQQPSDAGQAAVPGKDDATIVLTPEEIAEKAGRKGCKIKICSAFILRKPGPDVQCTVVKSVRKAQLDKLVSRARISWPWGKVRCEVALNLPREQMIKAMTEPKFDMTLPEHTVTCVVDREKEPATIKFSFAPKVKFENGAATSARLNWGKIEAPTLIKGAMWTATKTDNMFNVLESTITEDINDFITKKCPEVKDELN